MQIDAREDEQAHEKELALLKAETELAKAQMESERFAKAQDVNNNEIPDTLEVAKEKAKMQHESNEAAKDRKHESSEAEKDREIELAKIAAQKQIAKMRPKTTTKKK